MRSFIVLILSILGFGNASPVVGDMYSTIANIEESSQLVLEHSKVLEQKAKTPEKLAYHYSHYSHRSHSSHSSHSSHYSSSY